MHKNLGLLLSCALTLAACSSSKSEETKSVKTNNNAKLTDSSTDFYAPSCTSPFQDFGDKQVSVDKLIRPEGTWVLVAVFGYNDSISSLPNSTILRTLTAKMRQQLDEKISEGKSQFVTYTDLSKLDWKSTYPSAISIPYKLLCTTTKQAISYETAEHSLKQSSNNNLSSTLPYSINAKDLISTLGAKIHFSLKDGKDLSFNASLSTENTGAPLTKVESAEARTKMKELGMEMRFYQLEENKFLTRLEIVQAKETELKLSNSTNGYEDSKTIPVPTTITMVFEGVYELRK